MFFNKKSKNVLSEIPKPVEVPPANAVVSPQPGPEKKTWFFAFLIIPLLVVNGVLGYMYYQTKQQLENQKVSQIDLESVNSGDQPETEGPINGLANPASVYCGMLGYDTEIVETEAGQQGICRFSDGSTCDEWNFYSGKCGQEFSYCAQKGYDISTVDTGDCYAQECAVCLDENGEVIGSVLELSGLSKRLSGFGGTSSCSKEDNCCISDGDCEYSSFAGGCYTPEYVAKKQKENEEAGVGLGEAPYRDGVTCICEENICKESE